MLSVVCESIVALCCHSAGEVRMHSKHFCRSTRSLSCPYEHLRPSAQGGGPYWVGRGGWGRSFVRGNCKSFLWGSGGGYVVGEAGGGGGRL